MKKMILVSFIVLFVGLVPHVFAAAKFVPLAPITGLTENVMVSPDGLAGFFNNLYKYLVGLAAALAVIEIIWGGLEIALNKDNISKLTDEKGRIRNAILGLILVLSPVLVFSVINPSILNLSLNLPKLEKVTTGGTCSTTTGCKEYATCTVMSADSACTKIDNSCCSGTLSSTQKCCGAGTATTPETTCTLLPEYSADDTGALQFGDVIKLSWETTNTNTLTIKDNDSTIKTITKGSADLPDGYMNTKPATVGTHEYKCNVAGSGSNGGLGSDTESVLVR